MPEFKYDVTQPSQPTYHNPLVDTLRSCLHTLVSEDKWREVQILSLHLMELEKERKEI